MPRMIKGTDLEFYYNPATKKIHISDAHNPYRIPQFHIKYIDNIINELKKIKERFGKK